MNLTVLLHLNRAIPLMAALTLAACASPAPSADLGDDPEVRLFYEIRLTAPGTRSQGWRGVLYDLEGAPIELEAGDSIDTNLGSFISVPCRRLWDVCGMVHQGTIEWMREHNASVILGREPWLYRVHVNAECTRSEAWRGELVRSGQAVGSQSATLQTPMGPFLAKGDTFAFGRHGWFPVSWSEPDPGAGHWPCREVG